MNPIKRNLVVGLLLLAAGLVILTFAGHKHMLKGFISAVIGFILAGASTLTLYQNRRP